MIEDLQLRLKPVRLRQFLQSLSSWMVVGLMAGAVVGLLCGGAR